MQRAVCSAWCAAASTGCLIRAAAEQTGHSARTPIPLFPSQFQAPWRSLQSFISAFSIPPPMSASCPPPLACDTFPPLTPQDLSAGFAIDSKGHVTVDGISVSSVAQLVNEDHFFLLSLSRIVNNTREYAKFCVRSIKNCDISCRYKDAVSELLPGVFVDP